MLKNKKILITGATGFIGSNLLRKFLELNTNIYLVTRSSSNKWRIEDVLKKVKEYSIDLLDYEKLEKVILDIKPQIVFHAAVYGNHPNQVESKKIFETNLTGTVNLVNACRKIDFELFINTGSSSEYGPKNEAIRESDLLEPVNDYGVSKASATLYCQAIARREDRPITTLRLFSPYGYYEQLTRLIPSTILSCLKNINPKVSTADSVRDFVFIEDVIDAYVRTIDNKEKIAGKIFNIAKGKQHSVGEVVDDIIKLTGARLSPAWGAVFNPRAEPKNWQADISEVKDILKWEAKYKLEEGLAKTVKWFEKNYSLYEKTWSQKIKL